MCECVCVSSWWDLMQYFMCVKYWKKDTKRQMTRGFMVEWMSFFYLPFDCRYVLERFVYLMLWIYSKTVYVKCVVNLREYKTLIINIQTLQIRYLVSIVFFLLRIFNVIFEFADIIMNEILCIANSHTTKSIRQSIVPVSLITASQSQWWNRNNSDDRAKCANSG